MVNGFRPFHGKYLLEFVGIEILPLYQNSKQTGPGFKSSWNKNKGFTTPIPPISWVRVLGVLFDQKEFLSHNYDVGTS